MTALDRSSSGVAAIGLVVHPTRDVERPLSAVREWARERGVALGQVDSFGSRRPLGPAAEVADCDLVVAIGGDGTTLAAIRAAAPAARPVLGVACGSLGALTAVPAGEVGGALERFARGD
ncbi:MAG TPA: NAD(+)/NADH kinase, partial [Solirubrobacteraceae bacterium]|nr:NAD(+)/NADH kinase [Solirubrobacteraceae bacterium]